MNPCVICGKQTEYNDDLVAAKVTPCPTGFRAQEVDILRAAQGRHVARLIAEERGTTKGIAIIMELHSGSLEDELNDFKAEQQP